MPYPVESIPNACAASPNRPTSYPTHVLTMAMPATGALVGSGALTGDEGAFYGLLRACLDLEGDGWDDDDWDEEEDDL